jgi:hypothetical protein
MIRILVIIYPLPSNRPWSHDGVGREKVKSSAKIVTVRLNMQMTAGNAIHLYPLGSHWICKFVLA